MDTVRSRGQHWRRQPVQAAQGGAGERGRDGVYATSVAGCVVSGGHGVTVAGLTERGSRRSQRSQIFLGSPSRGVAKNLLFMAISNNIKLIRHTRPRSTH